MEFFTKIDIPKPDFSLDYGTPVAFFGSCFADNISAQFSSRKFQVLSNPFGTVYNPVSLAAQVKAVAEGKVFGEQDVFQDGCWNRDGQEGRGDQDQEYRRAQDARGPWHCWDAHGSLSGKTREECIGKLNTAAAMARDFLQKADVVFITLGTAFVYYLKDSGKPVSNCHRQDPSLFTRRMISVEEAAASLSSIVKDLRSLSPAANIVFTVSPLRHMADGAHENSLSKATLMLATAATTYFPSYEIVMDELRDYRFYADDMIHLSKTAEEYIFERMVDTYCDEATRIDIARVEKFLKMANHRIVNADSPATAEFQKKLAAQAASLEKMIPGLVLNTEN